MPRVPSEIMGDTVVQLVTMTTDRKPLLMHDVTKQFTQGAAVATRIVQVIRHHNANATVIFVGVDRSPSCGVYTIYDGTFTGTVTAGHGITVQNMRRCDVRCMLPCDIEDINSIS